MYLYDKFRDLIGHGVVNIAVPWFLIVILLYLAVFTCSHNRSLRLRIRRLKQEISELEKISSQVEVSRKVLSSPDERLSAILNTLNTAGKWAGIGLGEVGIGDELERDGYYVLPISLVIKGNYNQIGRFINWIERCDNRIQFTQIRLETKAGRIVCELKGEFIIL
ncbi:hypothetical protein BXT86_01275 [candidate division WOR-3 bacterium 4484_100]|uniref:Uncharacterized protein n=1 Tax=candidate division WOR-3 bacterium 4484_100 TaxID=1936077 RepID=A0A1V4QI63_UNCW3|nr:MAG: hypothetical protein BXT86_01275 [candidate division WOR-3 bacterium 4484_100]